MAKYTNSGRVGSIERGMSQNWTKKCMNCTKTSIKNVKIRLTIKQC